MTAASWLLLAACMLPLGYLYVLVLASVRRAPPVRIGDRPPRTRFVIAIAAHDEASVIAGTIERLKALDYPADLFAVHVVADHCSDDTAVLARAAGAVVHERNDGPRSGKGTALSWLFERVLADGHENDGVVIFDADTRVDTQFLRVMDARLAGGDAVVQGQHIIVNPEVGWFPALTWAMFIVDNRVQNLGRSNLGWSAKHMGDSICFRTAVLRKYGWGVGLTEDFQLRNRLLLEGIRIVFEPSAKGYGEAARTLEQARVQRARWLRGAYEVSRASASRLLSEGMRRRDPALIDGALQAYLPSFSTLTLVSIAVVAVQLGVNRLVAPLFSPEVITAWLIVVGLVFVYPFLGLALERAPLRAYQAILFGPVFVLWRSWLALRSRLGGKPVEWVRTAHGEKS